MGFGVNPLPVELGRQALEDVEQGRANRPQDGVDEVDPPGDGEPALVGEEKAAVEEQQSQLDGEQAGTVEDGCQPESLKPVSCLSRMNS